MPLVRISHTSGPDRPSPETLSRGVHDAMVETFDVPQDDLFQVVTEHAVGLNVTPSFLGIRHGTAPVIVQITCSEGRSIEKKKALFARIADHLEAAGVARADVIVNLIETKRENWTFGEGLAQYA
jgi:4-oxalocrotonate tautomerase